jgi:hypothetical protein
MSNGLLTVQPGDLITSQGYNEVVLKLKELEDRIAALEGSGGGTGIIINRFEPATECPVGQELSVIGTGFQFPSSLNVVSVDGVPVTGFRPGSTSTRLRFLVPQLASSIPASGRAVMIRVTNSNGTAEQAYRILPPTAVGDPPQITDVRHQNGSTTLRVGQNAVATGENFGSTVAENQLQFLADDGSGGTNTYDVTIDSVTANTDGTSDLNFSVPEMSEVPATGSVAMSLRVTVGDHPPHTRTVNVRRP